MKRISIIVVTYNSKNLIKDCLNSIFDNNDINDLLDVIIVDNASDDQHILFDIVKKNFGDKRIRLFSAGMNGGYGKGNNFGIHKTDSEIVIVMNPDVRFISPVFKDIQTEFDNPKLGMAGVDFIDGSLPYYFKPEYNNFYREMLIHLYVRMRKYDPQKMYMSGSLLIFDRQAFIDAGMFDGNIFMYYEEPDITNRLQKLGKEVKWLENIMVQHLAHRCQFNQKLIDIGYDSLEYYCSKYGMDANKFYQRYARTLRTKILIAKIVGAKEHLETFRKTLFCLEDHIKI